MPLNCQMDSNCFLLEMHRNLAARLSTPPAPVRFPQQLSQQRGLTVVQTPSHRTECRSCGRMLLKLSEKSNVNRSEFCTKVQLFVAPLSFLSFSVNRGESLAATNDLTKSTILFYALFCHSKIQARQTLQATAVGRTARR